MARLIALALTLGALGCAGRPPCGACAEGAVCDLDGACRPLAPREGLRFARALRLRPRDWGGSRRDAPGEPGRPFDELILGGAAEGRVYLAFDLPDGEVVSAVLRLTPAPRSAAAGERTLRAFRSTPFDGAWVRHRLRPARLGRPTRGRRLRAVEGRPLYLDVTPLVRGREGRVLFLGVEGRGGGRTPWRVASPLAEDVRAQPRLDLRMR